MPATDRAILRMAVYELAWSDESPTAVVISEAVELAKSYSTDDSGRFVNGMLSADSGFLPPGLMVLGSVPDREAGPVRPARTGRSPSGRT